MSHEDDELNDYYNPRHMPKPYVSGLPEYNGDDEPTEDDDNKPIENGQVEYRYDKPKFNDLETQIKDAQ